MNTKKIFCTIAVMVAVMVAAKAQMMVLQKGAEGRQIGAGSLVNGYHCGVFEGLDCWVMDGKKGVKHVLMTDDGLEPLEVIALPGTEDSRLLAASMSEGRIGLLFDDRSEKGRALVVKKSFLLPSLAKQNQEDGTSVEAEMRIETDTLVMINCDKKDEIYAWGAVSPSGGRVALVSIVEFSSVRQYTARAMVFDAKLNTIWDKEFAMGSMAEMAVTDDGLVVTMGHEEVEGETHFVFNVVGAEKADSYDVALKCDFMREVKLAGMSGHSAMVVATYNAPGEKVKRGLTGGMAVLAFSADSGIVRGYLERPIMNEEVNIFYNQATKKKQKEFVAGHLHVLGTTVTPYGAAMAVGRTYREDYTNANGSITSTYHATGISVLAVDTLGNIQWTRNIRREDKQKGDDDLMRVCMATRDSTVVLLKSEHLKYPTAYNIAAAAKEFSAGDKNNIVMYGISPSGNVKKDVVEPKTKHTLLRTLVRKDGTLVLLSVHGNKTRYATLKECVF